LDIPLKPLNLHERVESIDETVLSTLPLSTIKITGRFTLTDAHNWISNCLTDVPPNSSSDDKTHTFFYKSTFVGTCLILQLMSGAITVQSDNLSVVTIIKVN
jgi:Bardet-Biedl syndrome 7 protein